MRKSLVLVMLSRNCDLLLAFKDFIRKVDIEGQNKAGTKGSTS